MTKLSGFKKYFNNTLWLFLEKIVQTISGLVIGSWIARYLGPHDYGMLSYSGAFAGMFATLTTLGLDSIVVKYLVKYKKSETKILGTAFILKLLSSLFVVLLLYLILIVHKEVDMIQTMILIFASANIVLSLNTISFYFQAHVLSKFIVKSNITTTLISSMLKIYLLVNHYSVLYFATIVIFDSIVSVLMYVYFYQKISQFNFKQWAFSKKISLMLLKESWPIIMSGIAISIYMKIDQLMIGNMLGNEAVGIYSAATKISMFLYVIPVVISSSLFPAIIKSKEYGENIFRERMMLLYTFMVYLSFFIALFFTFESSYIIKFLYGIEYIKSIQVLQVHIWALVFVSIGVTSSKWMIVNNLQIYHTLYVWLSMLINIILNYFWIQKFGILGAAYATLISYIFSVYLSNIISHKTRIIFYDITIAVFKIKNLINLTKLGS